MAANRSTESQTTNIKVDIEHFENWIVQINDKMDYRFYVVSYKDWLWKELHGIKKMLIPNILKFSHSGVKFTQWMQSRKLTKKSMSYLLLLRLMSIRYLAACMANS